MIYLNGENVYETPKKSSKCPHCPAQDSEEEKKSRKAKNDLTIPSSMLNNGILSFGTIFSSRNAPKAKKPEKEMEKLLNSRILETNRRLPPFPFSGCTLNLGLQKPKEKKIEKLKKAASEKLKVNDSVKRTSSDKLKKTVSDNLKKSVSEKLKKSVSEKLKKSVPEKLKKTTSDYLKKTTEKKPESHKKEVEKEEKKVEKLEKKIQTSDVPKKRNDFTRKMSKNTIKLQTCANVASQTSFERVDRPKSQFDIPKVEKIDRAVENVETMKTAEESSSSEEAKEILFYKEESEKEFPDKAVQMIVMDSASDVHEDNPIVEQEKRAILEEMAPRINYFDFDSDVDDSPCGKYLNRLPQDFKIKTNGELEKFEIENIVRQYRFAYYLRIMNRHPKPDCRLKRKKRPDGLERLYFEPMRRKKRLLEMQKRLKGKNMKAQLGHATIWNGTISRKKADAPKMCQAASKLKEELGVATVYKGKTSMEKTEAKICKTIDLNEEERIYRRLKSKIFEKYKNSNSFFVEELSGVWEGDVIDILKNFGNGDSIKTKRTAQKVRLPNLDETLGKTCPFSPWPCPLGRVCPFPGTKVSEEKIENYESDRQMSNPEPFLTSPDHIETKPFKSCSFFKRFMPYEKVSVGTVTSTECVILPRNQFLQPQYRVFKPAKVQKNIKKEEPKKESKNTAPEKRRRPKEHRHHRKVSRPKMEARKLDDASKTKTRKLAEVSRPKIETRKLGDVSRPIIRKLDEISRPKTLKLDDISRPKIRKPDEISRPKTEAPKPDEVSRPKTETRKFEDWKRLLSPVRPPKTEGQHKRPQTVKKLTQDTKNDLDRLLKIKEVWKRRL